MFLDPIQLVWMVKQIISAACAKPHLIHHPDKLDDQFRLAARC
jgi:hypothetical protein